MPLFWFPDRKHDFDKPFDKSKLYDSYILQWLDRLHSMFKYNGLPGTIPAKWLEHYLLVNGNCIFIMDGDDLIVTTGGWGGIPDRYFVPTEYIVSNPYVKESTRRTYTIGEDCVLIRNDTYARGVMPILNKYCKMLTENDITMQMSDILARAMMMITATNDRDRDNVEMWLAKLKKGELSAIGELPSMTGNQDRSINITPFQSVAGILTDLIEYHQYLKAGIFNELGLNSNYNMKRESINSNESQLNDDMLHPLIDNMLEMRREALIEVNNMFGTNITVDYNSAWKDNEIENEAIINSIVEGAEGTHEENKFYEDDFEEDVFKDEDPEETIENDMLSDAINELTEAVNDLGAVITEDINEV